MNPVSNHALPPAMSPTSLVAEIPMPPEKPVKRYHVGLIPGGPAWDVTLAGISFPVTNSYYDEHGVEYKRAGAIVEMEAGHLKKVLDAVRNRIVRWRRARHPKTGEIVKIGADIYDRTTGGFRPERGDEPLAPYLIFEEAPEEFSMPQLKPDTLAVIEKALKDAEQSEQKSQEDPRDAQTREKHGKAKAAGSRLEPDEV